MWWKWAINLHPFLAQSYHMASEDLVHVHYETFMVL